MNRIENLSFTDKYERIAVSLKNINNNKVFQRIEEKEFCLNGKMYDISKETVLNDSVIFYCISDENEDMLHDAFAAYYHDLLKQSKSSSSQHNVIHLVILESILNENDYQTIHSHIALNYYLLTQNFNSHCIEIPSPPPKGIQVYS